MATQSCPDCGHDLPEGSQFCSACGASVTASRKSEGDAQPSLWHGLFERVQRAVAPKYQVRRILGHGGMAGVYLAEESRLGRDVAIKVMAPALMADPSMIRRFEQEARTIAQLDHSHIVTIYDIGSEDDLHYFAMTYVPGRSLADVVDDAPGPLPPEIVRHWMAQAAYALGYAHRLGVVHRDIKPGNILLNGDGDVVVTDFGIAKVTDEPGLTRTGMLVGTPAYMSPEQCASGDVTGATDQYALGIVAYQLLTGAPPFTGDTYAVMRAHVDSEPAPIAGARPQCPSALAKTVHRMLAKDPAERWPSMADVARELQPRPLGSGDPLRHALARVATPVHELVVHVAGEDPPAEDEPRGSQPVVAGERVRLEAEARGPEGEPLPDRRIDWRSDRPEVADVDEDGAVHGAAVGDARITARCGRAKRTVDIDVVPPPIETVEIRPTRKSIAPGDSIRMVAHAHRRGGMTVEGPTAVRWASSDPSIARVDADGNVEAVGSGEAVITATIEGLTAEATLEIPAPVETTPEPPDPSEALSPGRTDRPDGPRSSIRATEVLEGGAMPGVTPEPSFPAVDPPPTEPVPPSGSRVAAGPTDATGSATSPSRTEPSSPAEKRTSTSGRRLVVGVTTVAMALLGGVYLVLGGGVGDGVTDPPTAVPAGEATGAAGPTGADAPAPADPSGAVPEGAESSADPGDAAGALPDTDVPPSGAEPSPGAGEATDDPSAPGDARALPDEAGDAGVPSPDAGVTDPEPGTLRVATALPADAQVTATGGDGTVRAVVGGNATLPPGPYELRIVADGYENVRTSVVVEAGETLAWSPQLVERPDPVPAPPEEDPAAEDSTEEDPAADDPAEDDPAAGDPEPAEGERAADPTADRAAIGTAVGDFVASMDARDAEAVLPALPEEVRDGWRALLTQERVSEWSATLVGEPEIEPTGDSAVVRFSMALSYWDPSTGDVDQELEYRGRAEWGADGWRLLELRTVE